MSSAETDDFDVMDIGLQDVTFPPAIPRPRLPGTTLEISGGASDPRVLEKIRAELHEKVDLITNDNDVELPNDDVVFVGSELAGNAVRLDANPQRHLTGVQVVYTPYDERERPKNENPRAVGRLALLVSDDDPEFRTDPGRKGFHRGLLAAAALSDDWGYYPNGSGKTVITWFSAFPQKPKQRST